MLSQELIETIKTTPSDLSDWLVAHPGLSYILTTPAFKMSQNIMPYGIRVTCSETQHGRYLAVLDTTGQLTYIFHFEAARVSIEFIEHFVKDIENVAGQCHLTPECLIFRLPLSHQLVWSTSDNERFEIRSFFNSE